MVNNKDLGSDFKILSEELLDKTECVQKAIAAMRSDIQDFRAEYSEDMAEVKRELRQLRSNKVWIPRKRV
jgi:phage shock protein A